MRGPTLFLYGLLALYALEIVVPLLALAIALITQRTRRAFEPHRLAVSEGQSPRGDCPEDAASRT
jgi:hypothetical protein